MEGVLLTDGATCTLDNYIGNIKQPHFAEGQDGFVSFHMPHDYVPGTEMFIHVHWSHNSTIVTGGSVT
jgi:heme-degrading monooxygenase HmoA